MKQGTVVSGARVTASTRFVRLLAAWAIWIVFCTSHASAQSAPAAIDLSSPGARDATVEALHTQAEREKLSADSLAAKYGMPVSGTLDSGEYFELIRFVDGRPEYYITNNINAAISSGANLVRDTGPFNVDGSGVVVGVWDGGSVLSTHQELTGRVLVLDGAASDYHSTHVGGTIGAAGVNASALGMAPAVGIDSYDWYSDLGEMAARAMVTVGQAGKIQISNHSYGSAAGWIWAAYSGTSGWHWMGNSGEREDRQFGQYNGIAQSWDSISYNAPYYLIVKGAGNDRDDSAPSNGTTYFYFNSGWQSKAYASATDPYSDGYDNGGYDTLPTYSNAKNILTIGAVGDAVNGGLRSLSNAAMESYSGWGPTDDGRVKPDLVGNGANLLSADNASNTSYVTLSGTSMASPNVTGSAALILQLYGNLFPGQCMRSSTLKGLLIHTADDLGNAGPDYKYGWGLVNIREAARHIRAQSLSPTSSRIVESFVDNSANPSWSYAFTWNGFTPIRATLCWTDPAGPIQSGLDVTTPELVNDLDLRILGPGGSPTYRPFVLNGASPASPATTGDNTVDNVEQVLISAPPTAGTYTVQVMHKGTLTVSPQVFSLLIDGTNGDHDADGLSDEDEINIYGTNPNNPDSDNDGLNDGDEVNVHHTNPLDADSDSDGLSDSAEVNAHNTDPNDPDSDNDGQPDSLEVMDGSDPNNASSTSFMSRTIPRALNSNAAADSGSDGLFPQVTTDGAGNWVAVWASNDTLGGTIGTDYDILVSRSTNNGATWTAPVALNTNAANDSTDRYPDVTTNGAGNWVAVWSSNSLLPGFTIGGDYDILVSRSTDNGATWTAPAWLTTDGGLDTEDDSSPQVTTDSAGNWVAVWESDGIGDSDIFVSRSSDNGASWTAPAALNTNAASDSGGDGTPQVTTDGVGNWVAVWGSTDTLGETIGTDLDILVSRSTNNGATWTAPAALNTDANADSKADLSPQISTDSLGNWVAVWCTSPGGIARSDVMVSRSMDNGMTWTTPVALHVNAQYNSTLSPRPRVTTDADGHWVAAWSSNDSLAGTIGTDNDILFAMSVDSGATWSTPSILNTNAAVDGVATDQYPTIASDSTGQWVAAWVSRNDLAGTIGTDEDILFSRRITAAFDSDGDGLTDLMEIYVYNTDPNDVDTDNDGAWDGAENIHGSDPLNPASVPQGSVLRVDHNATGVETGATWATAFHTITKAFVFSVPGDEIWVADGTYAESLDLPDDRSLYGGFQGFGGAEETARNQADPAANVTTINSDQWVVTIYDGAGIVFDGFFITGGTYGGVYCWGSGNTVILSRCSIKNNNSAYYGAGIRMVQSSIRIEDCRIESNSSANYGGGVSVFGDGGAPTIFKRCVIRSNTVQSGTNNWGGGVVVVQGADVTLEDCRIENNTVNASSYGQGGGIYVQNTGSNVIARRCLIIGNKALGASTSYGGGVFARGEGPADAPVCVLSECAVVGNYTPKLGGGIASIGNADTTLVNCIVAGNYSGEKGGGGYVENNAQLRFVNCNLFKNITGQYGGAVYAINAWCVLQNSSIDSNLNINSEGNNALWEGDPSAEFVLDHCQFYGNTYWDNDTGGDFSTNLETNVVNPWVGSPTGTVYAGPAFATELSGTWTGAPVSNSAAGTTTLTDSTKSWTPGALKGRILRPNLDYYHPLFVYVLDNTATTLTVIGQVEAAAGDSYAGYDQHLLLSSPLKDAGTAGGYATGYVPTVDFDGDARPFGAGIDIGADEYADTDGDGTLDYQDTDDDNDGLSDVDELNVYGTNPFSRDTDGDGLLDSEEIYTFGTDPTDSDSDNDGQSDGLEVLDGLDPNNGSSFSPLPRSYPAALNTNAGTDSGGDFDPQVTVDGAGNWVAVWESTDTLGGTIGTDWDILVSRSTDNGATWTSPTALNTNAATDFGDDWLPQVTTDGAGNWVAVWNSNDSLGGTIGTDRDILVSRSTDIGATWTAPIALNTNAATDSGSDYNPQVAADGAGSWVAVWESSDSLGGSIGTDYDVLVSRSTTNGATWSAPAALNTNAATDLGDDSSPQVTTDGAGNWVAVWDSTDTLGGPLGEDKRILVSRSMNNGVTWTAPAKLNTDVFLDSGLNNDPQIATDCAGSWVTVWWSEYGLGGTIGADADILVSRSMDNGATWTVPAPIDTNAATDVYPADLHPQITTDRVGNWFAVWESQNALGNTIGADFDILVSRSTNSGATWTLPVALNTNAASDSGGDRGSQVTTDGAGHWVAVWNSTDSLGGTIGTDSDILFTRWTFTDTDGDGLIDWDETEIYGTNPNDSDSDNDGVSDGTEVAAGFNPLLTNPTGRTVYAAGGLPAALPDLSTQQFNLTIPGSSLRRIYDVNVTLNITHTYNSDLIVKLKSPIGTEITLVNHVGGGGDNFANTTLDDSAAMPITSGAAPFTGTFRPSQRLSAFNTQVANGTWTLTIQDVAFQDSGTLNSWSLDIGLIGPPTLSTVWVNFGAPNGGSGSQASPVNKVYDALALVTPSGTVRFAPGQASTAPRITQPVRLESTGGSVRIGVIGAPDAPALYGDPVPWETNEKTNSKGLLEMLMDWLSSGNPKTRKVNEKPATKEHSESKQVEGAAKLQH